MIIVSLRCRVTLWDCLCARQLGCPLKSTTYTVSPAVIYHSKLEPASIMMSLSCCQHTSLVWRGEHEGQSISSLLRPKSAYRLQLKISGFLSLKTQVIQDWSGASYTSRTCTRMFNMKIESIFCGVHYAIEQISRPSYLMVRQVFLVLSVEHSWCDKRPETRERMGKRLTKRAEKPK